mmetsp:Transcript_35795/g.72957  ORF Transcript_35795/g.72957 Transcript_35795/m.72957 type:complete len:190 (-) Transcript_35795:174-743(-)|eukprot:CAMPEP_0171619376 /NCGR_PEP_ID=MMETSP0990-20121206/15339_1 /TAXON_ID=483369 /ORGANISM="non described non described, Strain CCMP2098" /LENGTH=189 /DNA_ID=CAMNT_0012184427 /DNA_START=134 /DNA_END=703 /DNA_ORIENTATION=+
MKVIAAIALLFASATAFSPAVMRSQNSVAMSAETDSRRAMLGKTAGALGLAFSGASAAVADGSVSKTTVARARGKYGFRILALQDAVAKGDLASIAEEENAFKLFVSGAYTQKGAAVVKSKAAAGAAEGALFKAVAAGDKAGAKAAYAEFLKVADIQAAYEDTEKGNTQGYSTEYDWKFKTSKGTIYVR